MKKLLLSLLLSLFFIPQVWAVEFDMNQLRPIIKADSIVQVSKTIIFDATSSFVLDSEDPIAYEWDFGDGTLPMKGEEVVHTYEESGKYLVKLTVKQGDNEEAIARDTFAYKKLALLLTDVTEKRESIDKLISDSQEDGIFIYLIESYNSTTAFMSEESLRKKLGEQISVFNNADEIVVWTTRGSGINALTQLVQSTEELGTDDFLQSIENKTITVISDENLNTLARIMQGNYNIIRPKQIILTRHYEFKNLINSIDADAFLIELETSISEYRVINQETGRVGIWNSISHLVNFMIAQGIPSNTVVLLLMLPVIATIITFMKQVIGITTFGLYLPSIITLSFLALGLKFGLIILLIIIATGALVRQFLERFSLLHTPRIAIILTISTLIMLLMLALGTYVGISQIATIAVFPMLIMTTLAEKFVTALSGKGIWTAVLLMLETTAVSLICYWVVEWQYLQNLILGHPEIILLLLIVNYILGRWTGLRLLEYVRFREIMKHTEE